MNDYEKLQQAVEILRKYNLPISPILEYSISEKLQELSSQVATSSCKSEGVDDTESPINAYQPIQSDKYFLRTGLRVIRSDGSVIQEERAASTLCQVIKEVGAEKVYNLFIPLDGMYLVMRTKGPNKRCDWHHIADGYYVNTHSNTLSKKRQIERIFSALHLPWRVEIA